MRIGIYGGAFDPPHLSHVLSVTYALATMHLDEVFVVPCWGHAFGKKMSPFSTRVELTRRAFKTFDRDLVTVTDLEKDLKSTYTIDLLEELQRRLPLDQLVFIMGEDEWQARHRWHRWDEIEKIAEVAVVGREGVLDDRCPVRMPAISSTWIRNTIKEQPGRGLDLIRPLVPSEVLDYIREHNLFS